MQVVQLSSFAKKLVILREAENLLFAFHSVAGTEINLNILHEYKVNRT
jgi:hypothetical protein